MRDSQANCDHQNENAPFGQNKRIQNQNENKSYKYGLITNYNNHSNLFHNSNFFIPLILR